VTSNEEGSRNPGCHDVRATTTGLCFAQAARQRLREEGGRSGAEKKADDKKAAADKKADDKKAAADKKALKEEGR